MRASANTFGLKPGFTANFAGAMGSMRATSALAWASVTPGLSLAMPWQQKLIRPHLRAIEPQGQQQRHLRDP